MRFELLLRVVAMGVACGMNGLIAAGQVAIPTVPIGNPGNPPDPLTGNLHGLVSYSYNIGATEVTNAQYAAFLNAKAASDPFFLYNTSMAGSFGGITRSGSPGSYTYATISGRANNPVNFVSFWDATRFANWLHNGQGSGDTETGAYTLTSGGISANTITRNAGWQWAVTSEDEWYKAAYHQPASAGGDSDNYWLYPTQSNAVPTTAQANFNNVIGNTTAVGSYAANYYGTFDTGGNVWEWNEAIIIGATRGLRGGSFNGSGINLRADYRYSVNPADGGGSIGFRVSQVRSTTCPADYNNDNGVDSDDVIAFFADWDLSAMAADLTGDGGVDGDDVIYFFGRWDAGC